MTPELPEASKLQSGAAVGSTDLFGVLSPQQSELIESRRRWCFEKAMQCRQDLDIVADLIYKAAEIESYLLDGKNPRADFQSSVDVALAEVDHASIANVGDDKKRKVMSEVRKWLKEYDAL